MKSFKHLPTITVIILSGIILLMSACAAKQGATGILLTRYSNCAPSIHREFKNGVLDGEQIGFYKDGTIRSKSFFRNGAVVHTKTEAYDSLGISRLKFHRSNPAFGTDTMMFVYDKYTEYFELLNNEHHGWEIEHYSNGTYDSTFYQYDKKENERYTTDTLGNRTTWRYVYDRVEGVKEIVNPQGDTIFKARYLNNRLIDTLKVLDEYHTLGLSGGGNRSKNSIMRVVRDRAKQLKHIYNDYLKMYPGLYGEILLEFTIAPSGKIIKIKIIKDTTGNISFLQNVFVKVRKWKFEEIENGNCTITLPFAFSE